MKLWRLQHVTIKGKMLIFKTFGKSKVAHLALVKDVPSSTIAQSDKTQKQFTWKNGNPKLKQYSVMSMKEED